MWDFDPRGSPSVRSKLTERIIHRARTTLDQRKGELHDLHHLGNPTAQSDEKIYTYLVQPFRVSLAKILSGLGFKQFFFAFDRFSGLSGVQRAELVFMTKISHYCSREEEGIIFWHILSDTSLDIFRWEARTRMFVPHNLTQRCFVHPVWPYLSFDTMAPAAAERTNRIVTPRHAFHVGFLKSYGRPVSPLWFFLSRKYAKFTFVW